MDHHDRRRDPRVPVDRPVKLQCVQSGRYYAGRTCDLSSNGAHLRVDHPALLAPGQQVRVGIAQSNHQAVLRSDQMIRATVKRSLALDGIQDLAVQFDEQNELAAAS